jgi:hypothetical protein
MRLEKFFGIVDALEPIENGCKLWPLAVNGCGYGIVTIREKKGTLAHRYVLERYLGRSLAEGECACHTCDNPACVEETHLWVGSHAENIADMVSKKRNRGAVGANNYFTGKHFTGEQNSFYGKTHSEQALAKMSAHGKTRIGSKNPRFGKGHLYTLGKNPNAKPVLCTSTGVVYSSVIEAAKSIGVTTQCVAAVCKGSWRQTKGLKFVYVNKNLEEQIS